MESLALSVYLRRVNVLETYMVGCILVLSTEFSDWRVTLLGCLKFGIFCGVMRT